ncbi:MAG: response regulator transcription factor [Paracoccaceae bacterium]
MRFLLIEDNASLGASVKERLALDGHAIDWAQDLAAAEDCLGVASYDLILLDIMLPDGDGREFLRRHRAASRDTPVVVLTARSQVSDRVDVLDLGADDYITKPFDFSELEARCRAVLRRRIGSASNKKRLGDLEFDALAATVTVGRSVRELRNRELRLMEILSAKPGMIFSKAQLVDRLFSFSEEISENAIEVYVGRLRRKLEGSSVRIETVRGVGYRMVVQ